MTEQATTPRVSLPVAIIVAAIIIAGALFFTNGYSRPAKEDGMKAIPAEKLEDFRVVSASDHILGSPDAEVSIIEFSDFECPYCALFHATLHRVVSENSDVNWIYRHFPIASHVNALEASVASECVATLAGNEAFWQFTDNLFLNQGSFSEDLYNRLATELGVDLADFAACRADNEVVGFVNDDLAEIVGVGGDATPTTIIVTKKGDYLPFIGALEYEDVMGLIEFAREN